MATLEIVKTGGSLRFRRDGRDLKDGFEFDVVCPRCSRPSGAAHRVVRRVSDASIRDQLKSKQSGIVLAEIVPFPAALSEEEVRNLAAMAALQAQRLT